GARRAAAPGASAGGGPTPASGGSWGRPGGGSPTCPAGRRPRAAARFPPTGCSTRRRWRSSRPRTRRRLGRMGEEPRSTDAGIEIRPLYGPDDLDGFDADRDLGRPGAPPFTRGVYPTMYRGRLW